MPKAGSVVGSRQLELAYFGFTWLYLQAIGKPWFAGLFPMALG